MKFISLPSIDPAKGASESPLTSELINSPDPQVQVYWGAFTNARRDLQGSTEGYSAFGLCDSKQLSDRWRTLVKKSDIFPTPFLGGAIAVFALVVSCGMWIGPHTNEQAGFG